MEIFPGIETVRNYYWKRSAGWTDSAGNKRWWERWVEFVGLNGAGGVWINIHARQNGGDFMFCDSVTLSYEDSKKLIGEILQAVPAGTEPTK